MTAVGGTSLGIGANGKTRGPRPAGRRPRARSATAAWGPADYLYGSGGGTSRTVRRAALPARRRPGLARADEPDRAATGAASSLTSPWMATRTRDSSIGETQTFPDGVYYDQYRIGGTSLSAPLFSGLMAVANQLVHFDHGFVNPVLYQFTSRTRAISDVQHVTGGVVRVDYVNGVDATNGTHHLGANVRFPGPDDPHHTRIRQRDRSGSAQRTGVPGPQLAITRSSARYP